MGGSAGGNIAYHMGLSIATGSIDNLKPMNIRGLILHQPFFGGTKATESELSLFNEWMLPPVLTNFVWELALHVSAGRDHEYCNPTAESNRGLVAQKKVRLLGLRVLVTANSGNPLGDRQVEFAKVLEQKGVMVVSQFSEGHYHRFKVGDLEWRKTLVQVLKDYKSATMIEA